MSKASTLGLQIDPTVQSQYSLPLDPEYALDTLHTSWHFWCGFPRRRSIDKNASLANSVLVRAQHDSSWRPPNLSFTDGVLASTYQLVNVVSSPAVAVAATTGGGNI
jgi:hypothetical protein